MEKFKNLKSIPVYMPILNIDTDMIIPKQFLKTIKRTGLGKNLFYEMRYDEKDNLIKDFILNKKPFTNSKILLAGKNFGCGSSREHAPWALTDFGINAVQINKFYQTAYLPTTAIDQIGESTLSGGFNAYRSVMVGASGALYGVLVGFAMIFPNARLMLLFPPIPVKAKVLVPILILSDLFFGFSSYSIGPIAHFAHVGGAITGLIMMRIWKKNDSNANRWDL